MKAIIFFEAKEVCQVEFDRHERLDNEFNFYLNDAIVGSFCYGYCFVVDENKSQRWYVTEADIHNLQRPTNSDIELY